MWHDFHYEMVFELWNVKLGSQVSWALEFLDEPCPPKGMRGLTKQGHLAPVGKTQNTTGVVDKGNNDVKALEGAHCVRKASAF